MLQRPATLMSELLRAIRGDSPTATRAPSTSTSAICARSSSPRPEEPSLILTVPGHGLPAPGAMIAARCESCAGPALFVATGCCSRFGRHEPPITSACRRGPREVLTALQKATPGHPVRTSWSRRRWRRETELHQCAGTRTGSARENSSANALSALARDLRDQTDSRARPRHRPSSAHARVWPDRRRSCTTPTSSSTDSERLHLPAWPTSRRDPRASRSRSPSTTS